MQSYKNRKSIETTFSVIRGTEQPNIISHILKYFRCSIVEKRTARARREYPVYRNISIIPLSAAKGTLYSQGIFVPEYVKAPFFNFIKVPLSTPITFPHLGHLTKTPSRAEKSFEMRDFMQICNSPFPIFKYLKIFVPHFAHFIVSIRNQASDCKVYPQPARIYFPFSCA